MPESSGHFLVVGTGEGLGFIVGRGFIGFGQPCLELRGHFFTVGPGQAVDDAAGQPGVKDKGFI